MSLLTQLIPPSRTCADVDVTANWCACFDWRVVSSSDSFVTQAALTFVSTINQETDKIRGIYMQVMLDQIETASKYEMPLNQMTELVKNRARGGRSPRLIASI